jgi:surface antigen
MRASIGGIILAAMILAAPLAGCSGFALGGGASETASQAPAPAGPATTADAAPADFLSGPSGAGLNASDRETAYRATLDALDSGQRKSWRGEHGVFGDIEPAPAAGSDGCRSFAQTIYVAGRPNKGHGVGCKQPDGGWKMGG